MSDVDFLFALIPKKSRILGKVCFSLFLGAKDYFEGQKVTSAILEILNARIRQKWPDEIKLFTSSIQSE